MSIEDRYLSGLIAVQYPEPTDPTSVDGMQLAAGPSDTVSDAGGGVRVGRAGVPYRPPSMRDITEPAGAMLDMGAATVKGAVQGFVGLPGDLEGIGRLVLEKMGYGVDQNTVLPKTDDVKKWLDTNVGQVGNGQNPYESIGEVAAPGGQIKAVKAAGRGAKALAPKADKQLSNSQTPVTIQNSGASYETVQDGPFYRVSRAGNSTSQTAVGERRVYEGTAIENRAAPGRSTVYGTEPGQAEQEFQLRLTPENNQALKVAEQYTQRSLGKPYDYGLTIEPSSLSKQSPVGIAYDLAAKRAPGYDAAVFSAYKADPEYGQLINELGIKSYDELVQRAYQQLEKETIEQFNELPVRFSFHKAGEGNYLDSKEMLRDVHLHNHMYVYQGGDQHEFLNKVDQSTGLNSNEMFRAVHDYFGHAIKGNTFGPIGEEVAWASHAQMYSPLARIAMTAETRGQNSFVNYTPINANLVAQMEDVRRAMIDARRMGKDEKVEQYKQVLRDLGSQWQYAEQASVALPPEMTRLDYKGGMPEYIRSLQSPDGQTLPVDHYSKAADMKTTDPTKYGTGAKGVERERLDSPNAIRDRTFFYESGGKPEEVVVSQAPYKYKGIAKDLYDYDKDPLNLRKLSRLKNTSPADAKYNANVLDEQSMINDVERMIFERGFRGYVTGKQGSRAIVSFEPVAVERTQ